MNVAWGAILIVFGLISWLGQGISAFMPALAVRVGVMEPEADVDPAFYADIRGEAVWDFLVDWPLPVAGLLLVQGNPLWAYFGLIGGSIFLYFAGRGIIQRIFMRRHGIRVGSTRSVSTAYIFLTLWGLIAIFTIIMAVVALPLP